MVRFSDKTRPAPQKSAHYQQINAEIKYGIDMAADPVNANLAELAHRTTTINSPWFARTCRVCNDNFREGDLVRLCPDCSEPYHDDGQFGLDCWKQKFAGGAICRESEDERFRSEEHTSELQSRRDLVCRLLLEKKKGLTNRNTVCLLQKSKKICHN